MARQVARLDGCYFHDGDGVYYILVCAVRKVFIRGERKRKWSRSRRSESEIRPALHSRLRFIDSLVGWAPRIRR